MWIGVPVLLSVVGYYFVSPIVSARLSPKQQQAAADEVASLDKRVHRIVGSRTPDSSAATHPAPPRTAVPDSTADSSPQPAQATTNGSSDADSSTDQGGPEVEISVRSISPQGSARTATEHPRHKVRRRHPKPKPKVDPETTDEGSFGGTQDQAPPPANANGPADPPTGG